jgi:hypothetical protein
MANYMARVELHSATWNDYEVLHVNMQRRGYYRIIQGSDGKWYQLPTGTYMVSQTNSTLQNALNLATAAATETGKPHWVVVADWTAASWLGLPVVQ